ncbi:MAG TPA: sulfatase-like hydrolase/transferase [Thermoanaerobaculia bacterium]|jgi:arylsulfatase A-like enzyme
MRRRLPLLAALLFALACREKPAVPSTYAGAPVIFVSVDTLRADHLPMFGYRGVETPNLDRLRNDGVLFTSAYAQAPLTLPSHTTVLTGLLPEHHGVRNNIGFHLDAKVPTIASLLRGAGYRTGAAVSAYVLRGNTGLRESFDFFEDSIENRPGTATGAVQRPGNVTAALATQWIAERGAEPFFFLLHLFEPHSPYEPPAGLREKYANAPYDGEIAAADAIVGEFIDSLKARGIYDRAIIVFFSDHGEGLSQHGEPEHGIFLYREAIHVPLVVKLPSNARAGETIASPVGLVDLLPTIAELTNVAAPARVDGVSLFAAAAPGRRIYSETMYPRIHLGWSELRSLESDRHHYIQAPRSELYDMTADPGETRNILADERRVAASMKEELGKHGTAAATPGAIDPEEARKLAALGYLSATQQPSDGPLPDPKDRIGEIAEMTRATMLAHEGRDDEAIAAFRGIVAKNPRLSDGWNQLALTLEKRGRYEEAADAYRSAIDHAGALAGEFALSRGSILLRLGRYDEAAQHADLGKSANPAGARLLLARIALARKDLRTAETEARAARDEPSAHHAASVVLAQTLAEQGRLDEALTIIDATAPVDSRDSTRGDVLARMQRNAEAIEAFRRSIAAYPHTITAYARLAIVYTVTGRNADARAALEEMLRNNPSAEAQQLAAKTRHELGLF